MLAQNSQFNLEPSNLQIPEEQTIGLNEEVPQEIESLPVEKPQVPTSDLIKYEDILNKYKEVSSRKPDSPNVLDALPDILAGIYNTDVFAKGTQVPLMKMPNAIKQNELDQQNKKKVELSELETLAKLYPKSSTDKSMTEYQKAMLDLQAKKLGQVDNKPMTEYQRRKLELDSRIPDYEGKEKIKEDVKVRTENRKDRKQLAVDYGTWDSLEKQVQSALDKAEDYSKKNKFGSGRVAQVRSLLGSIDPETQALETDLSKLSLDQLTKQFSGMSKAIDTPQERARFESTVPTLGMDDKLLIDQLEVRLKAAQDAKKRIAKGLDLYDRTGNFVSDDTNELPGGLTLKEQTSGEKEVPQKKSIVKKQYSASKNKTRIIYSDGTEEVLDGRQ